MGRRWDATSYTKRRQQSKGPAPGRLDCLSSRMPAARPRRPTPLHPADQIVGLHRVDGDFVDLNGAALDKGAGRGFSSAAAGAGATSRPTRPRIHAALWSSTVRPKPPAPVSSKPARCVAYQPRDTTGTNCTCSLLQASDLASSTIAASVVAKEPSAVHSVSPTATCRADSVRVELKPTTPRNVTLPSTHWP